MELAKHHWHPDEYDGPEWAPFNLWMAVQHANGPEKEYACRLIYGQPRKPGNSKLAHLDAVEAWELIAKNYPNSISSIAFQLPRKIAEIFQHWNATPKWTRAEYSKHRTRLATNARQLASELRSFPSRWDYGDERADLNFTQFLTEAEQAQLDLTVSQFPDALVPGIWEMLLGGDRGEPSIVPNIPTLLDRVSEFFKDDANHPPFDRPGDANALRNYVIDRLIGYFELQYGEAHDAIIARLTALLFDNPATSSDVAHRKARFRANILRRSESPTR